ncbi:hypothetical protein N752_28150 [Desulforamulus aquiferis]|nr:hypothetical protein N752_28150 [Desulforamulus aquiferis]
MRQKISLRKMPAGHWLPFNVGTDEIHECILQSKPLHKKPKAQVPLTNLENQVAQSE